MITFAFKKRLLNVYAEGDGIGKKLDLARDAAEALENLKGQVDRMPNDALAQEIADFLRDNWGQDQWRSEPFADKFFGYTKRVAVLSRPDLENGLWFLL